LGTDNYTRIYEDGSVIFLEGESGDRAYVVEEGVVEIWCHRDNERVLLQELKPGAIFGEMSVIDGSPRSANASANGKTKLIEVTSHQLRSRLSNSDPIIQLLVKVLLERFRNERRVHRGDNLLSSTEVKANHLANLQQTGEDAIHKIRLEKELEVALQKEEFFLLYQPIVDLRDQRISGFEALIRWDNPLRGMINPAEFIELAEETRLIVPIGEWVVEQACADIAMLNSRFAAQENLFVNINFSGRQLMDKHFLKHLRKESERHSINPDLVNIEITEGIFLSGENLSDWLDESRTDGYKIVLDDFGTGYSSLSYLSKYPIDKVKVDKSFVQAMEKDASARAIIQAVIGIARAMNMTVVAEGVETSAQMKLCHDLGCEYGQGFLFGKPVTVDIVSEELSTSFPQNELALS